MSFAAQLIKVTLLWASSRKNLWYQLLKKRSTYKKLWSAKHRQDRPQGEEDNIDDDRAAVEERVAFLETRNKELEQLVSLMEDPEIKTFKDGKYKDSIRLTIMELLTSNVSLSKVDKVICTVLRNLARKEVTPFHQWVLSRGF